ncbi:response regulator [Chloroflexia bacterium SDU3-3]|nr:response regulator [Chloroflexia bacterium SDU3-3]
MSIRIIIADDEKSVRQLLELVLQDQGYEVISARNGDHLIRLAQENIPDLILVDLMMPGLDGYEAIRQLRNDTRTAHIPMIILTARSAPNDVVVGFETGADDYVTKPFNIPELLARIKGHLRRAALPSVRNPLSGLPGNILLTEEIKFRLKREEPFALLYIDMDNFKAFNDTYGFARGDRVIKLMADVMTDTLREYGVGGEFAGHIGGDDFAILASPDQIDQLCAALIESFDRNVRALYDPEDLERGYLQGVDRHGVTRQFPIVSISIGGVTNRITRYADYEDVGRVAAEMKHYAKQQPGSSYAIDVRGPEELALEPDRRGAAIPAVLLISADAPLHGLLGTSMRDQGYRVFEAKSVPDAHALLAQAFDLALIVVDARLGEPLWELATTVQESTPDTPVLALLTRAEDAAYADAHQVAARIQQPFHTHEFLEMVLRLAPLGGQPASGV